MDNISDTDFSVYYPDMRLHPKIVPTTQAGLDELRARPEAMDDTSNIIELSQRPHASIALSATEGTDKEISSPLRDYIELIADRRHEGRSSTAKTNIHCRQSGAEERSIVSPPTTH
ncbi:hypothetical protein Tsp_07419 [Trichinella spiralis]|uniref:hypothetical protein n=1 Tax=Trichinella spiralis TaxID=6334 RepID=UPI0001EFCB50|nr:hypothetical protein Tsp_07419 [Trichinella spiralis]